MPAKKVKYYGVAARTGGAVFVTWPEVESYLKDHPGKEFHKSFPTEQEAWDFVSRKRAEIMGVEPKAGIQPMPNPVPASQGQGGVDDDDAPPW